MGDATTLPPVYGLGEVAGLFGVSKQRARTITSAPTFPEPRRLRCGPVWDQEQVLAWARAHRRGWGP